MNKYHKKIEQFLLDRPAMNHIDIVAMRIMLGAKSDKAIELFYRALQDLTTDGRVVTMQGDRVRIKT